MKKPENVDQLLEALDHPLNDAVSALRKIILDTDPNIAEQVKWNSPSFYYSGEMAPFDPKEYKRDIVVLNLHKKDSVLLVFPTGARIEDPSGILEGKFTDGRKVIKFSNSEEVKTHSVDLKNVIRNWIETIE